MNAKFRAGRCLIGKDCGLKHYGANSHRVERDFNGLRRRQLNLYWLDNAIREFPSVLRTISEIRGHPGISVYDNKGR
jgi:hypothetical protein